MLWLYKWGSPCDGQSWQKQEGSDREEGEIPTSLEERKSLVLQQLGAARSAVVLLQPHPRSSAAVMTQSCGSPCFFDLGMNATSSSQLSLYAGAEGKEK